MEMITDGLQFTEGPVVMADGSIVLVEIRRGTLTRVLPDGRHEIIAHLGGGPNGAAVGPDGAMYVCNNGGAWEWEPGEASLPAFWRTVAEQTVFRRYTDFSKGVIDIGNFVFFVAATAVFLFLTTKVLESRRWK